MWEESTDPEGGTDRPVPEGNDVPPTGDATVDEGLRVLPGLEARPVHEHPGIIEEVHQMLQDRLADGPADDHDGQG